MVFGNAQCLPIMCSQQLTGEDLKIAHQGVCAVFQNHPDIACGSAVALNDNGRCINDSFRHHVQI